MEDVGIGPATDEEAFALLGRSTAEMADALERRVGLSADEARSRTDAGVARLLPEGVRTQGQLFLVARREGAVVAGVWGAAQGPDRAGEAWIYFLWVAPEARRQGLARRLVAAAADRVREAGATDLTLNVFGDNAGAIALYESLGFSVVSQQMRRSLTDR